MNINKKKDNFVQNLKEFLIIYREIIQSKSYSARERKNCGNQARDTAEAFCKSVIGEYIAETGKGESNLYGMILKLKNRKYNFNTYTKRNIIDRLHRIRIVGNNASHNTQYRSTLYDIKELNNNLLYLSTILLGEEETQEIQQGVFEPQKNNPIPYLIPLLIFSSGIFYF